MGLPINFETKLKEAKAINGGYPYSIKAEHLMKNFVDAKLEVDEQTHSSGLQLEEFVTFGDSGHPGRGIRLAGNSASGSLHPCRISINADDPAKVDIAPATLYHETGSLIISAQSGLTPLDVFLIEITRDSSTRVVAAAAFVTKLPGFNPTSTKTSQYIHIGSLSDGIITQHWFHDVSVFEDLAVVNGELKLVPLAMLGSNFYDPPAP